MIPKMEKTVKNTTVFIFVHDMKTENPKMAINYLFDVCFNSFAYLKAKKQSFLRVAYSCKTVLYTAGFGSAHPDCTLRCALKVRAIEISGI